jgi:two-component system, OmpR family, KDP operon response regulator KdpE
VNGCTIFVADDDETFRGLLEEELLARGYEVIEARDGAETLDKLALAADGQSAWPDILVLDVHMPDFSGLGILSALQGIPERPPTLLVTGLPDKTIEAAVADLAVYRVFRKPIDLEDLMACILDATQRGRAH